MVAIYNDRFDMAATLIELGADVNDGSLYVAVEMRDATTDQFAFDGSRRRPDHPNTLTALDLMRMLLDKGAEPEHDVHRSVPLDADAEHRPLRQHAVLPRRHRRGRRSVEADGRARRRSRADADGAAAAAAGSARCVDARAARPRQSECRPSRRRMVAMNGGRGPAMTGGPAYIRDGARSRIASLAAGRRKRRSRCCSRRARTRTPKGPDGATLLHQAANAGNVEMIRALAAAKVDFTQKNKDGMTALDVAEGKHRARGAWRPRRRPASGRWTRRSRRPRQP